MPINNKFFFYFFLCLLFPTFGSGGIQRHQGGPGVAGQLTPLNTKKSKLVLTSEWGEFFLHDSRVEVQSQYNIYNPTPKTIQQKVGIPTIHVPGSAMAFRSVKAWINDKPVQLKKETGGLAQGFDYSPYVPLIHTFETKEVWYTTIVTVFPKTKTKVRIEYSVPYLFLEETLQGRAQQSPKLFRYQRAQGTKWAKNLSRSVLYFKPRVQQERQWNLSPDPYQVEEQTRIYQFHHQPHILNEDINLIYDPIDFRITHFGYKKMPKLITKKAEEVMDFKFENLVDGDPETIWCEGEKGEGLQKGFEVEWGKLRSVKEVLITPAFSEDKKHHKSVNRLRTINLHVSKPGWISAPHKVLLPDRRKPRSIAVLNPEKVTLIVLQILEVYPGEELNDTCIAEIEVKFAE